MQKHVNLEDLVKSFPTNILLQNLASIQKRTSPVKLLIWLKNQGKVRYRTFQLRYFWPGCGCDKETVNTAYNDLKARINESAWLLFFPVGRRGEGGEREAHCENVPKRLMLK